MPPQGPQQLGADCGWGNGAFLSCLVACMLAEGFANGNFPGPAGAPSAALLHKHRGPLGGTSGTWGHGRGPLGSLLNIEGNESYLLEALSERLMTAQRLPVSPPQRPYLFSGKVNK